MEPILVFFGVALALGFVLFRCTPLVLAASLLAGAAGAVAADAYVVGVMGRSVFVPSAGPVVMKLAMGGLAGFVGVVASLLVRRYWDRREDEPPPATHAAAGYLLALTAIALALPGVSAPPHGHALLAYASPEWVAMLATLIAVAFALLGVAPRWGSVLAAASVSAAALAAALDVRLASGPAAGAATIYGWWPVMGGALLASGVLLAGEALRWRRGRAAARSGSGGAAPPR